MRVMGAVGNEGHEKAAAMNAMKARNAHKLHL